MAVASSEEAPDHCDFSLSSSMNMAKALLDGGCVCVCVCVLLLLADDVDNSTTTTEATAEAVYVSKSSKLVQAEAAFTTETNAANEATLKKKQ